MAATMSAGHLRPWLIPVYFTLGGLAGGLLFLGGLARLWGLGALAAAPGLRDVCALPLLVVCGVILTADLTHPLRFFRLLLTFRPSSAVSWGSWILTVAGLVAALEAVGVRARLVEVASCVTGLALASYTGVLLTASARLRWHATPLFGAVYLTTALTSVSALVVAAGGAEGAARRAVFALAVGAMAFGLLRRHLEALAAEARAGRLEPAVPPAAREWLVRAAVAGAVALVTWPFAAAGGAAGRWGFAVAVVGVDLCVRFASFWLEEGPGVGE